MDTCDGEMLQDVQTLRVTPTRLSAADLKALLDSRPVPGLTSFVYEAAYPPMPVCLPFPDDSDHFQPSDAIRSLKRHRTTLESLHLDLRARGCVPPTDGGNTQPLSETLKDFTALKHVFLSASMLCNRNGRASYTNYDSVLLTWLLPAGVVSLELAGDLGPFTPQLGHALRYLAKAVGPRKQFKALRRVRCDRILAAKGLEELAVKEAFDRCGVDFDYDTWPLSSEPMRCAREDLSYDLMSPRDWDIPLPDDDVDL